MARSRLPVVGVSTCVREEGERRFHIASDQYLNAVLRGAGALPLLLPALGPAVDTAVLLGSVDGLLFTGSPSNVEPHHYGGTPSRPGTLHDPQRDATTLPLIRAAIAAGVPVLAICRGHQELNVALGGTLHQNVHELPGRRDHRSPRELPIAQRYAPAHPVQLTPGGLLAQLLGGATEPMVNSLHWQAIDRLAPGLEIEATALDGTIEAVRCVNCPGFVLGLQWHPEWNVDCDPLSQAIFASFGDAVRGRSQPTIAQEAAD